MKKITYVHVSIMVFSLLYGAQNLSADTTPKYDNAWVNCTLKGLTLRQKIGQLFIANVTITKQIVAKKSIADPTDPTTIMPCYANTDAINRLIQQYHIGGIIFLGGKSTIKAQVEATRAFQKQSHIPLLVTLDAEWGLSMRLHDAMPFARNRELDKLNNTDLIYQMGKEIGRQLALIGVHMNLAPVIDVDNNPLNPVIGNRSFSSDKKRVAKSGIAYMQGLHNAGILACAKHFPGHGDTTLDSHLDLPLITHTRDHLNKIELYPFVKLIKKGIPAVMIAHLEVPALEPQAHVPTTLSYNTVTTLLKKELGFKGLVITDALNMQGVSKHHQPGDIELKAFLAGNDILLCPIDIPKAVTAIENAIKKGTITEQELDARVKKILTAKAWAFTQHPSSINPVYDHKKMYTQEAYTLQKKIIPGAVSLSCNQTTKNNIRKNTH